MLFKSIWSQVLGLSGIKTIPNIEILKIQGKVDRHKQIVK